MKRRNCPICFCLMRYHREDSKNHKISCNRCGKDCVTLNNVLKVKHLFYT